MRNIGPLVAATVTVAIFVASGCETAGPGGTTGRGVQTTPTPTSTASVDASGSGTATPTPDPTKQTPTPGPTGADGCPAGEAQGSDVVGGIGCGDAGPTSSPAGPTPTPFRLDVGPTTPVLRIDIWQGAKGGAPVIGGNVIPLQYTGATGSCLQFIGEAVYSGGTTGVGWTSASSSLIAINASGKACIVDNPTGALGLAPISAEATGTGNSKVTFSLNVEATAAATVSVN